MNNLPKAALTAALIGAAVAIVAWRKYSRAGRIPSRAAHGRIPRGSQSFTLEEITGESENREWGGGSAGISS